MYKPEQFAWLANRRKNVYSQWGEDGILEAIFERIGAANRWCCECGAADGVFFSNTKRLIDDGWSAVLIEADEAQFKKLQSLYRQNEYVSVWNYRIGVEEKLPAADNQTFDSLLGYVSAPLDLDLLVIDVDGQDYWLFNSLLKYKPRVVMVEYDPTAKDFIPLLNGDGQAGLDAIADLGIGKYYWPVAITPTNVIFVQQELCPMLAVTPEEWTRRVNEHAASVNAYAKVVMGEDSHCSHGREINETKVFAVSDGAEAYFCRCCKNPLDGVVAAVAQSFCRQCANHLHESESGSPVCVHCGLSGVWPLAGKSIASKSRTEEAPAPSGPKLAAVMSTPRLGFLATMDCIFQGLAPFQVPLLRGEGAFWHHSLERAIERAIAANAELVLTFDYDVVFNATFGQNEIAKLVCLMEDNPDVDCIVAAQMKREGGPLLASTSQQVRLLDSLVPITQGHFGLTIFRASAFRKLPKPWFRDWPNEAGEWNENRVDADIHFWKQAVDAGLNVQMSLDVLIGHLELIVTWPGQNLQPVYQPLNDWRERGKPAEAFDRQRVLEAVKANPALLYGPKLEMGG